MAKPFFFRITAADLLDFATDPDGEGMTLLRFAKELQKGQSDIPFIQSVIEEASTYIEKKRKAGAKGGKAKASSAKAVLSSAKAVAGDALVEPSTPLASNRSSNSSNNNSEALKPKPIKTGKRFTPPTLEKVRAYCLERSRGVDPERWMNHYTSNGWKVGKNSMKDWKAAVRTWENNDGQGSAGSSSAARGKAGTSRFIEPTKNVADYGEQDEIPDW